MDVNTVTQIIGTVGFPIAMCCALLYHIREQNIAHKEETDEFVKALNSNTLVLQKLCDKLGTDIEVK